MNTVTLILIVIIHGQTSIMGTLDVKSMSLCEQADKKFRSSLNPDFQVYSSCVIKQ